MQPSDVRALSKDQIADKLAELGRESLNLRFQKNRGQLENTARIRQVRRDIARLLTIRQQPADGTNIKGKKGTSSASKKGISSAASTKSAKSAKGSS